MLERSNKIAKLKNQYIMLQCKSMRCAINKIEIITTRSPHPPLAPSSPLSRAAQKRHPQPLLPVVSSHPTSLSSFLPHQPHQPAHRHPQLHDLAITQVSRRIGGANAGLLHATMVRARPTADRSFTHTTDRRAICTFCSDSQTRPRSYRRQG